ncbi:hypothetical protein WICPIJ_010130 [Wickerhamomyces pijperi]|uniref:Programmed cell death protein 2 C-terminal domain-containing protein n=1 Tax=Wickerhamomyces pijperi TaxID=599730 RepID=A0A9P8TAP8_WICPI|nr:hypothetical protein WICPIJ_010130 [Wickerhamomyces pijperi]
MSGYSSEEDEDLQTIPKKSEVYLGYVDVAFNKTEDEPTVEDTFVGGQPIWLHHGSPPSADLISCKSCTNPMSLIVQAFSPLEDSLYDRIIYVFGCKNDQCNRKKGSVRAIRAVCKDPKKMEEAQNEQDEEIKAQLQDKLKLDNARNFLFDGNKQDSNPFGASTDSSNPFGGSSANPFGVPAAASNPFASSAPAPTKTEEPAKPSFASIAKQSAPAPKPKTKSTITKKLPEYPGYFLYVDQEKFNKKPAQKQPNLKIDDSALDLEDESNSASGSGSGSAGLSAESQAVSASLQDSTFQHFSEVISYNPHQVLRYEINGKPLLATSSDEIAKVVSERLIPRPGFNPSSERRFELQVMPKLIMDFEDEVNVQGGIEWVTIIVYTDKEDFTPELDDNHVGYVEEWCGVQWEEPITTKTRR